MRLAGISETKQYWIYSAMLLDADRDMAMLEQLVKDFGTLKFA